jgi:uncharacterized lipoprotein YddW (UPF0748 family)
MTALMLPAGAGASEGRAFWLTRWNARDAGSISSCLDGMASLGANTIFCQVYGDSMALYDSDLAPRSHLVAPGFDALATAVSEGRSRGIEVYAYMNVCNVWSGGLGVPADAGNIVRAHPEWAVVDSGGKSDIDYLETPDAFVFFCPEWQGFRDHCVSIALEIATRYDVDGIHLDYLRFPVGAPRCFCAEHRRTFRAKFGRDPTDGDPDFIEARFATIERMFAEIHDAVSAARPGFKVSASFVSPTGRYFQDAGRILEAGKVDIACPMIYTSDPADFEERARYFVERSGGRLVYPGISAASGAVGEEVAIARRLGLEGQAVFAWSSLDDAGRTDLEAAWASPADPPPMPWKDGTPDGTAPVISGLRAAGVLGDEATVLFHSDEQTRARIEYGLTSALGSAALDQALEFDHAVRLPGLLPSRTYYYQAVATDAAGNATRSARLTFTTAATSTVEVVVDDGDAGFETVGTWSAGSSPGGNGDDYLFSTARAQETAHALFRPYLPRRGLYEVAVWYVAGSNRAPDVRIAVVYREGNAELTVDQRTEGQRWNVLGEFPFDEGEAGHGRLSNAASEGVVIADALRFRLIQADRPFIRGDANADGSVDVGDVLAILFHLYGGIPAPCPDGGDANDSGTVSLNDATLILQFLFRSGAAPSAPYPETGYDPKSDGLAECR